MFSFIVANACISAVKALPRALRGINAGLDLMLDAKRRETRRVVNIDLGVSSQEIKDLLNDPKFVAAIARAEHMKRRGDVAEVV